MTVSFEHDKVQTLLLVLREKHKDIDFFLSTLNKICTTYVKLD